MVQNRKENSHHDHIPFSLKGNGNLFSRVHKQTNNFYWEACINEYILKNLFSVHKYPAPATDNSHETHELLIFSRSIQLVLN